VSFLRSSLFAVFVSLLYVAGYCHGNFHRGCAEDTELVGGDLDDAGPKAPPHQHGSQCSHCPCEEVFFANGAQPVRVLAAVLSGIERPARLDELPPETVPLGIDYPPQLA
jgi:hypothetical protein